MASGDNNDDVTWADCIAAMGTLRQELAELGSFCPFTIPGKRASESEIRSAEMRLGHSIDPLYRQFLRYGNGWPEFFLDTWLLRADELGGGATWSRANEVLDYFYDAFPEDAGFPSRAALSPIAANPEGTDVFAVHLDGQPTDGGCPVLWLPGDDTAASPGSRRPRPPSTAMSATRVRGSPGNRKRATRAVVPGLPRGCIVCRAYCRPTRT